MSSKIELSLQQKSNRFDSVLGASFINSYLNWFYYNYSVVIA